MSCLSLGRSAPSNVGVAERQFHVRL